MKLLSTCLLVNEFWVHLDTIHPTYLIGLFLFAPLSSAAAAAAKSRQSCPTPCDPTDGSPPGHSVPGFSRQEHWSGLPFPSPMRESEVAQSCPTLRDPMDCSLPGSSVHRIFQARVLEWVAIAFSNGTQF